MNVVTVIGPWAEAEPGGRSLNLVHNSIIKEAQPDSNMAPNLQLTYLDRVLLEIVETERMYVRDLRMIVEVCLSIT